MAPCLLSEWILMVLATGVMASGSLVRGRVGQNIMLPCRYRVDHVSDVTSMCWGRGSCPTSGCSQLILWTDGWRVTERQSSRYQLRGNVAQGDVSLTIVNAAEADEGLYCCRVEIPGWFNDEKHRLEVVIERAGTSTARPHTYLSEHSSAAADASDTSSITPSQCVLTSSSESPPAVSENMSESTEQLPGTKSTGIYVVVSVCVVLLVILVGAFIISTRYLHNKQKLKKLQTVSAVSFSSPEGGGVQGPLEAGARAEENIYVMD